MGNLYKRDKMFLKAKTRALPITPDPGPTPDTKPSKQKKRVGTGKKKWRRTLLP
jgi:hypothetical protein